MICLTIYYWYWLRDILMVRRSNYRTRFMNCVGILYNFGMVGDRWRNRLRWDGFWLVCENGTHTQDSAAGA